MATYILIHGSWHNGMVWHKVATALQIQQHVVYTPTLTGFESLERPAGPEVGLQTNIQDIRTLIEVNDLHEVILVGHSYAGFILSGLSAMVPERIAKLVYLDAFIPDDNQSLFDLLGAEYETSARGQLVNAEGKTRAEGAIDPWLMKPGQPQDYGVTDPDDIAWLKPRMVYTPIRTFEERVHLGDPNQGTTRCYFIRCTAFGFLATWEQKAKLLGWPVYSLPTGHDAMITMPGLLTEILIKIAQNG